MRPLIIFALLFALPAFAAGEDVDTPETRRVAALEYLQAANTGRMMSDMATAMTQNLSAEKAEEMRILFSKHVRMETVEDAMLTAMVKHFTTRELSAMATFYGSPEGQSSLAKFGPYMADAMPMIQAEVQRAMKAAKADKSGKKGT